MPNHNELVLTCTALVVVSYFDVSLQNSKLERQWIMLLKAPLCFSQTSLNTGSFRCKRNRKCSGHGVYVHNLSRALLEMLH